MKTSFLVIGFGLAVAACGGTTDNSSGSGGAGATGAGTGGHAGSGDPASSSSGQAGGGGETTTTASTGGQGGVGGIGVGGSGGSSCGDVPPPVGQLDCGGGSSAVSSGSGPIACATSCIDQGENAYEVYCQGNQCECHYYPASSGTSQSTSGSSGPTSSSTGSGGEDPSLICTCTVPSNDACASQQHCCPAPWQ